MLNPSRGACFTGILVSGSEVLSALRVALEITETSEADW
jgi:hypothetical protein